MRSGGYTLQETLTAECASILKHSLGLATRRGHAQITPLHLATTLLTLNSSTLKNACLKSQLQNHSSLHCRALELCFNVALNRLPTITPSSSSSSSSCFVPSLSNALIAALKRAQAHQRRGCIEQNHQHHQEHQPLLSVKVELDQLIVSILDDPSVSRVMREAGFESISVKNNLQQNPSNGFHKNHFFSSYNSFSDFGYGYGSVLFSEQNNQKLLLQCCNDFKEDVKFKHVFDVFLREKKKNVVIIGDSVSSSEGLVHELMKFFEKGEVPNEMKKAKFVKFNVGNVCLRLMKREQVEMNVIKVMKRKVYDCDGLGGGCVLYVGDLKWIVENYDDECFLSDYDAVGHVVEEIGKMFCEVEGNKNVWLVATSSYQTYMRCQMRVPTLENQWGLHAVPVSSGSGLGLSLHSSSVHDSKMSIFQNPSPILESKLFSNKDEHEHDKLDCCEECASNYEKEAQLFKPSQKNLLPSWLQSHSLEAPQKDEVTQLKKKWNRLCQCLHQNKQTQNHWNNPYNSNAMIYPYNSSYPYWPNQSSTILQDSSSSISFADSIAKSAYSSNIIPRFRRQQQSSTIEFNFNDEKIQKNQTTTTTLDCLKEVKTTLALGNSTFSGSDEKKVENLTTLQRDHICKVLQENVPWQCETISSIVEAMVDSKSTKCATWLFLQGNDSVVKKRLALAIAESVFGSVDSLFRFDMLKRENSEIPFSEMVVGAVKNHEKFVLLIENVDFGDTLLRKLVADEFGIAKFGTLGQKIIICTNGGTMISEEQKKDSVMKLVLQISGSEKESTFEIPSSSLPCNKRRVELDLFSKLKIPRIEENDGSKNREFLFSRQSCVNNTLDLNVKADEEDEDDDEGQNSPISSDLTRETLGEHLISNGSFDPLENLFEINKSSVKEKEMMKMFMSRIKESFEEVYFGKKQGGVKFNIQDKVIEEIGGGCSSFTNKMFEKWLKDIFQKSLEGISGGGKNGIVFTLCWGGKEDKKWDSGFMGSCLPKNIQIVNYLMD